MRETAPIATGTGKFGNDSCDQLVPSNRLMGCRTDRTTQPSSEEDTMTTIAVAQIAALGSTPVRLFP